MADGARIAPPRAVLLDLGGTLLREQASDLAAGVRHFLENAERPLRPDADEIEGTLLELETVLDATRATGRELGLLDWITTRLGIDRTDAAVAELAIWLGANSFSPREGALEALEALAERGIPFAVLSNTMFSGRTLAFELQRQGLGAPYEFVRSSADEGWRKPSPRIFHAALARIGVAPEQAWYVGDSWGPDVTGAARVGMTAIWLSEEAPRDDATPHRRIGSWKGFVELLEESAGST